MTSPENDWQSMAGRLAKAAYAEGDPTGWFDRLYGAGAAGSVSMPWERDEPHPMLAEWAAAQALDGAGRRGVVVGCGLGADAEFVASLGFSTVGFDISPTAVRLARERHQGSTVEYEVGDLLEPRTDRLAAFDLVVEIFTVQALPDPPRDAAIVNVGRLVAPGGTLVTVEFRTDETGGAVDGPPFPLRRREIEAFAADALDVVSITEATHDRWPGARFWLAEFTRPPG